MKFSESDFLIKNPNLGIGGWGGGGGEGRGWRGGVTARISEIFGK